MASLATEGANNNPNETAAIARDSPSHPRTSGSATLPLSHTQTFQSKMATMNTQPDKPQYVEKVITVRAQNQWKNTPSNCVVGEDGVRYEVARSEAMSCEYDISASARSEATSIKE